MNEDILKLAFKASKKAIKPAWYDDFLNEPRNYYRSYLIPKTELKKKLDRGYRLPYSKNNIPSEERNQWRKICAPCDILKQEQIKIRNILYSRSPSSIDHCVSGKNRYTAMKPHAGKRVIMGLDIKNAFPSVSKMMVKFMLLEEGFEEEVIDTISNLSTLNSELPQGSPCSPVILNLVRKTLDRRIRSYLASRYPDSDVTVYVDNYFISSNDPDLNNTIPVIKEIARTEGFIINNKKIHIMRKGSKMHGLGLVVSRQNNGHVTVQPDKKYRDRIRAILHQTKKKLESGLEPPSDFRVNKMRGMIETLKGSVYYNRYKSQFDDILNLMHSANIMRLAAPELGLVGV